MTEIALYHFCVKQIKRSAGQSAVAAAAYRAGERLYSDYYGEYSDYTRKGGVIHSEIILPPHAPPEYQDRATLWNAIEHAERHKKAQLAYSFDIALQNELTMEENIELAREFVQRNFVRKGMIADVAIHQRDKGDGGIPNPHFHVLTTMRPINPDGTWGHKQKREYLVDENGDSILDSNGNPKFNAVATTDWHCPETLEGWRKAWCELVNEAFERKGITERIDHRSYERQGLDLIPTIHEGPTVRQMEAKGIKTDKGELNRWIKATNRLIRDVTKKIKSLFSWLAEIREELSQPQSPNLVDLLTDYYVKRNSGAYSQKGKVGNLKKMTEVINYLRDNNLLTVEELETRLSALDTSFESLKGSMKAKSKRMEQLRELIRGAEIYHRLKPIYDELNGIKWKKQREKFKSTHDSELRQFYAVRRVLTEELKSEPINVKAWQREYDVLRAKYAGLKEQYKPLKEDLAKLRQVQYQVSRVINEREPEQQIQHNRTIEGR